MSGIGDALFGSEGTPAQVVDTTPEEFAGLRGPVARRLRELIESGGGPTFTGVPSVASGQNPFAAALGANETALLQQLMAGNAAAGGSTGAARDLLTRTAEGAFLPGAAGGNPFLDDVIKSAQRSVTERFNTEILPTLRTSFTRAGQFIQPGGSSPFDEAAAIASRGVANSLADIATDISFGVFEGERGRQQQAATQLPQLEQADVERTISVLQAQALPRLVEQLGIDEGLKQFNRRVDVLLEALGHAGDLSSPSTVTTEPVPGTSGFAGELLGSAGAGFGKAAGAEAAAALFALSDRRLKQDVERIGTLPSGLAFYRFTFTGDATPHTGVMADEVREVHPDLVDERGGYAVVDYGQLMAREFG